MISTHVTKSNPIQTVTFTTMDDYCPTVISVEDTRFYKKGVIIVDDGDVGERVSAEILVDSIRLGVVGSWAFQYLKFSSYVTINKALTELIDPSSYEAGIDKFKAAVAEAYELLYPVGGVFTGEAKQFEGLTAILNDGAADWFRSVLGWHPLGNIEDIHNLITHVLTERIDADKVVRKVIPAINSYLKVGFSQKNKPLQREGNPAINIDLALPLYTARVVRDNAGLVSVRDASAYVIKNTDDPIKE